MQVGKSWKLEILIHPLETVQHLSILFDAYAILNILINFVDQLFFKVSLN